MDGYATDTFDVARLVPGFRPPPQPDPGHDGAGVRDVLALCLAENSRPFADYDERLLRPRC